MPAQQTRKPAQREGIAKKMQDDTTENRVIYLQMELKKGSFTQNEQGDCIFDVEASNENLDLEQQKVLQQALLNSKDYFLTNGVISKDHLHQKIVGTGDQKKIVFDEDYIIGEPIAVYTDGSSTRVKGKLYKSNQHAQKFIQLLKDGSTRIKASVGGIAPLVQKAKEQGTEIGKVVSVLWNDLALTISPVNPTVSPAYMVKSLSSLEFVKALSAGTGTDHAQFTGGRAMVPEDMNKKTNESDIIEQLIKALLDETVTSAQEAEQYLSGFGIDDETAEKYIRAVLENEDIEEVIPMGNASLWNTMKASLEKSFGGKGKEDDNENKSGTDGEENLSSEQDDYLQNDEQELDTVLNKAMDAGPALEAMAAKIDGIQSSLETLAKSVSSLLTKAEKTESQQDMFGKSMLEVMNRVEAFGNTPVPRGAAVTALENQLAKGGKGIVPGVGNAQLVRHKQFTPETKNEAMEILLKAASAGTISAIELGKAETQINKSLRDPAFQIDQKYIALLQKSVAAQSV